MIESIHDFDFVEDTHSYVWQGRKGKSATQLQKQYGLISYDNVRPEVLERKREVGKVIDNWTAEYDRTGNADLLALPEEIEGYGEAWINFRRQSCFEVVDIQKPLMGFIYGILVGGTPDRIMRTPKGELVTPDIKCCAQAMPGWSIQTGIYEMLQTQVAKLGYSHRCAVQLFPNSRFHVHWHEEDRDDADVIHSIMTLEAWKQNKLKG